MKHLPERAGGRRGPNRARGRRHKLLEAQKKSLWRRVRLVRGEGRGVSSQYGVRGGECAGRRGAGGGTRTFSYVFSSGETPASSIMSRTCATRAGSSACQRRAGPRKSARARGRQGARLQRAQRVDVRVLRRGARAGLEDGVVREHVAERDPRLLHLPDELRGDEARRGSFLGTLGRSVAANPDERASGARGALRAHRGRAARSGWVNSGCVQLGGGPRLQARLHAPCSLDVRE